MPPESSFLLPTPTLGAVPFTPAPTPGASPRNQVSARNDVLPEIVVKLEQMSAGFDETNKRLGEYKQLFEDSRTAFTRILSQQEKEHERVRSRFEDTQQYEYDQHRENMAETTLTRYGRTAHWQGKLALVRTTNTQLQQTQEATTRQAAAMVRGADTSARQAADIARAANTFERVANTLDRVADPVQSLFDNLTAKMRWSWNCGVPIIIVLVFATILIAIKQNELQNAASAPVTVGSDTTSRIKGILMSNPSWKDLLNDPRPVFEDV